MNMIKKKLRKLGSYQEFYGKCLPEGCPVLLFFECDSKTFVPHLPLKTDEIIFLEHIKTKPKRNIDMCISYRKFVIRKANQQCITKLLIKETH
jgi:hypothetical protein